MKIKTFIMSVLFGFMVSACDMGNYESVLVTPHYSIFYSEDFARRFSLPVEKAVDLNNAHLKAVVIGIEKINRNYECNIYFYYDDAIKLYSPNGHSVFFKSRYNDGFFAKEYNELDFNFNFENVSNNISPALFRSKSLVIMEAGRVSTIGYSIYKEHVLPNLNLASLDVPCINLNVRHGEAEVWVKKNKVENYEFSQEDPLNIKHPENSYRFDIPLALLKSVQPMIDRINAMPVDPSSLNVSVQYGAKE